MYQPKWKSPVVWTSSSALVLLVLKQYGLLAPLGLDADSYNAIFLLVLGVLIELGIVNNPNRKDKV